MNTMIHHTPDGFRDTVIHHAARAFFVSAYADYCENEPRGESCARASCGDDWMDIAPEATPLEAYVLAGEMWASIEAASKINMFALAARANQADGGEYEIGDDFDAEHFGHYLAMQYMGHGVSWFDDHEEFEIEIPYSEVSYLSFDFECYHYEAE